MQSSRLSTLGEVFRAGEWVVRPASCRISRGGEALHLRPMLMNLLVALAERAGEVVTKEEIFDRVWEGRAVGESVLTRDIAELRRLLHDDTRHPRYIETIAARGYRLLVPVVSG